MFVCLSLGLSLSHCAMHVLLGACFCSNFSCWQRVVSVGLFCLLLILTLYILTFRWDSYIWFKVLSRIFGSGKIIVAKFEIIFAFSVSMSLLPFFTHFIAMWIFDGNFNTMRVTYSHKSHSNILPLTDHNSIKFQTVLTICKQIMVLYYCSSVCFDMHRVAIEKPNYCLWYFRYKQNTKRVEKKN